MSGIVYVFLGLSMVPGLLFATVPCLVRRHKKRKHSHEVQARILSWEKFTWYDSRNHAYTGLQLTYQYWMNGETHTCKGLPLHNTKGVLDHSTAILYVNPDDPLDIWEDGDKGDLWLATGFGIALMAGGAVAVLAYFL